MDLLKIIRAKISMLAPGDYIPGLEAVLIHLEAGNRHWLRGQESADDTLFTDVIYRTNQAFEGALKEAYRVLAKKDPSKRTPSDIESYLQTQKVFRQRILSQITNYRMEWRNPSTHDYKLDFDEGEAFLAIVTVCAFFSLLLDQVAEELASEAAKAQANAQKDTILEELAGRPKLALADRVANLLSHFTVQLNEDKRKRHQISEVELTGAVSGFLSAIEPNMEVLIEPHVGPDGLERPDLIVYEDNTQVIVELKRTKPSDQNIEQSVSQMARYLAATGVREGVVYFFYSQNTGTFVRTERSLPGIQGRIIVTYTEPA